MEKRFFFFARRNLQKPAEANAVIEGSWETGFGDPLRGAGNRNLCFLPGNVTPGVGGIRAGFPGMWEELFSKTGCTPPAGNSISPLKSLLSQGLTAQPVRSKGEIVLCSFFCQTIGAPEQFGDAI